MDAETAVGIRITPSVVEFSDADANVVHQMNISIQNLSKVSKSIVLSGTKTEKFQIQCKETQKTIAPGLELKAVVEYLNTADEDWEDVMVILVDGRIFEVPLKAFAPRSDLEIRGTVNFGVLVADGKILRKEIAILNHGTKNGSFKIHYNGKAPITILPKQGSVKAGYSQPIRFEFASKNIGEIDEEIQITLEQMGVQTIHVTANVVQRSLQLLTLEGREKLDCIKFGPTYYGTDILRSAVLYNCGPESINFVIILEENGEGQEMGVDLTKTASAILESEPSYSMSANTELTSLVTAIPCQGKLEAYESKVIHFKFSPRSSKVTLGWNALEKCQLPPRRDFALFVHIDTVESMTAINGGSSDAASGDSRVELALTGTALPVCMTFLPEQTIDFGECPSGSCVDYPCVLKNESAFLPIVFRAQRTAHFQPIPAKGKVEANQTMDFVISFRPNQIGNFKPILHLEILGDVFLDIDEASQLPQFRQGVVMRYPITCIGMSPSIPGIVRSKSLRSQSKPLTDGSVGLQAKQSRMTTSSVRVWTSKDNDIIKQTTSAGPFKRDCSLPVSPEKTDIKIAQPNDRASSIRPSNRKEKIVTEFTKTERYSYVDPDYAWTEDEEKSRQFHRQSYKDFTDSLRKKKSEKSKKNEFNRLNNSLDLGMKPAHGLVPPKLKVKEISSEETHMSSTNRKSRNQLLTSKEIENNRAESLKKRVSDGLKAIPTSNEEVNDCKRELLPQELYQVSIEPKNIDYGEVCATSVASRELTITNNLSRYISFKVGIDCRELRQTSPLSQVIPPMSVARLEFIFESNTLGKFERSVPYVINDKHKSHLLITADVVTVALSLSTSEMMLRSALGMPAEAGMRKTLTVYNKRNMAADFSWTPIIGKDGTSFSVRPAKGIVNPFSSLDCEVVFYPSYSAPLSGQFLLHVDNGNQLQIQCNAELSPTSCSFVERRLMFGALPLNLATTRKAHLKNTSLNHAYFKVVDLAPIAGMTISPKEGVVPVGGKTELKVSYKPETVQKFDTQVEVSIRGWKTISLRMGGHVDPPCVTIDLKSFNFGGIHCGAKTSIPFTIANLARSSASLIFDLAKYRDFQLKFPQIADSMFQEYTDGYYYLALKGQQQTVGYLEFAPLEVASYDFLIQVSVNHLSAPSPPPSPYPASIAPSRSQNNINGDFVNQLSDQDEVLTPCRRVLATALRAPLQISHHELMFKLPSGYYDLGIESIAGRAQGIMFVNNSDTRLQFSLNVSTDCPSIDDGTFKFLHQSGPFLSTPGNRKGLTSPVWLESGETFQLGVLFTPPNPGKFLADVPLILNDDVAHPYRILSLRGELEAPILQFDPECIQLTPVPLRTETSVDFQVIAKGYRKALQLDCTVPDAELEDGSILTVLQLAFNGGSTIQPCCRDNGDKEPFVLSGKITFSSPKPVGVNTIITFKAAETTYELPVTAVADNCLLTCYSFLNTHQHDYHVVFDEQNERHLLKGTDDENPIREAELVPCVSPIRPPTNLSTSATTTSFGLASSSYQDSSNTGTSSSYRSTPQGANGNDEEPEVLSPYYFYEMENTFPESETEEGKYLRDVMKVVQRWISAQSWASGHTPIMLPFSLRASLSPELGDDSASGAGSWNREGKKETRTVFDIVSHFCGKPVPGIPINPTFSMDDQERTKQIIWMLSTLLTFLKCQGAMLSNVKAEHLLDSPDYYRLTELIQQDLESSEKDRQSGINALERDREKYELLSRKSWTNVILQIIKVLVLGKIVPSSFRKIPLPENYDPLPPFNPDPFSSNVYSISERLILVWVNHLYSQHRKSAMWKLSTDGTPPSARWIVNFDNDFLDGLVLASLLAAHAPFMIPSHFHSMYTKPNTAEQCLHNALKVVEAMRFLGLDYDILATDITEPNPVGMLLLCIHLYRRLPQYLPKTTIEFLGPLHSTVTKYVRLQNPSTKPLTYQATLSGEYAADFVVPQGPIVKVSPKGQMQLLVEYRGRFLRQCKATLILVGRRQGSPIGSTLVFKLSAAVDKIIPMGTVKCESPCYELKRIDLEIVNPFAVGGEFRVVLVESKQSNHPSRTPIVKTKSNRSLKDVESRTDHGIKKSPRRKQKTVYQMPETDSKQKDEASQAVLFSAFWSPVKTVNLDPRSSHVLEVQFLPLHIGSRQCSVLFLNETVGEFLYSIEAEATLPLSSILPFAQNYVGPRMSSALAAERTKGAAGADDRVVYWQCEEGDTIEEELSLPVLNAHKETALVLVSQQRMSDTELKRRLLTGFISNATILAAIQSLDLGDKQIDSQPPSLIGSSSKSTSFTVESDSKFFKVAPQVTIPVAMDTKSADETITLPVQFTPDGQGHYPCQIILRSPHDIRVYQILCIVNPKGYKAQLEFTSPTHESVTQEIPFVNYSNQDWNIIANISGDGFLGPKEFIARANETSNYPLVFCPYYEGLIQGQVSFVNSHTLTETLFHLRGVAQMPAALSHIIINCQAKNVVTRELEVCNRMKKKMIFQTMSDLDIVSGPAVLTILPSQAVRFPLTVSPWRRGTFKGAVSFISDDNFTQHFGDNRHDIDSDSEDESTSKPSSSLKQESSSPAVLLDPRERAELSRPYRMWYSVEIRASAPPPEKTLDVSCAVYSVCNVEILVSNPTNETLTLEVIVEGETLKGPSFITLQPCLSAVYKGEFSPINVGTWKGCIIFQSPLVGEFWYDLDLVATSPAPKDLPIMQCPLGRTCHQVITLTNPADKDITFHVYCSSLKCFSLDQHDHKVLVPPKATIEIPISFSPTSLGPADHKAQIIFSNKQFGELIFNAHGIGTTPAPGEEYKITSALGTSASLILPFKNPYDDEAVAEVMLNERPLSRSKYFIQSSHGVATDANPAFCLLLRQTTNIRLGPRAVLDLPISFAPNSMDLHEATCIIKLKRFTEQTSQVENVFSQWPSTEEHPLQWIYTIKGIPESVPVKDLNAPILECRARGRLEERVEVSFSGFEHGLSSPNLAYLRALSPMHVGNVTPPSEREIGADYGTFLEDFTFDFEYPDTEAQMALQCAVGISLKRKLCHKISGAILLLFDVVFAPHKPFEHLIHLCITATSGGIWRFPFRFRALDPPPDDVISIEAAGLNKESTVGFRLTSLTSHVMPFQAFFASGSDRCFYVTPSSGNLLPSDSEGTLFKVTYCPQSYGKTHQGKLVVQSSDMQWNYNIKGILPQYRPSTKSVDKEPRTAMKDNMSTKQKKRNYVRENLRIGSTAVSSPVKGDPLF